VNRRTDPSAMRAILDYPPIRIRPNLPAHAGAKEKNPVGSSRFGTFIISPKVFTHQQILLTGCRESVRKGLTHSISAASNTSSAMKAEPLASLQREQ